MTARPLVVWALAMTLSACAVSPPLAGNDVLRQQVIDTEQAFAQTMAKRDFAAFAEFIDDEAIFLAGDGPLRGKRAVLERWRQYFEKAAAPFSWTSGRVEVLDSAGLALSAGPVYDAKGKRVASFTSVWRREATGRWRIVFDKGDDAAGAEH
jgi:ketosteroid isomerase-like protein